MSTTSTRSAAFATRVSSTCAVAAGALGMYGLTGLFFHSPASPALLLGSVGCAAASWVLASAAVRPEQVADLQERVTRASETAVEEIRYLPDRVARASVAAVEAFRTPPGLAPGAARDWRGPAASKPVPPAAEPYAAQQARRWFPRLVNRRSPVAARRGLTGRIRMVSHAGRSRLARVLHKAASFVAPTNV
ncbi:hypothetical protein [Paludisphaera mucosa]|uniref:Uncharacterized protein n=1 Tax=Paludisphaera mucosa TaxID=3030827 RepID=A0ABT6FG24_9BACT|nr:hypothetical protein [Paludisphaera mucosa]MDG3006482.1 hypothetical protein [Paludisphaera mucosa]